MGGKKEERRERRTGRRVEILIVTGEREGALSACQPAQARNTTCLRASRPLFTLTCGLGFRCMRCPCIPAAACNLSCRTPSHPRTLARGLENKTTECPCSSALFMTASCSGTDKNNHCSAHPRQSRSIAASSEHTCLTRVPFGSCGVCLAHPMTARILPANVARCFCRFPSLCHQSVGGMPLEIPNAKHARDDNSGNEDQHPPLPK